MYHILHLSFLDIGANLTGTYMYVWELYATRNMLILQIQCSKDYTMGSKHIKVSLIHSFKYKITWSYIYIYCSPWQCMLRCMFGSSGFRCSSTKSIWCWTWKGYRMGRVFWTELYTWLINLQIIITGGNLEQSKEALKLAKTHGRDFTIAHCYTSVIFFTYSIPWIVATAGMMSVLIL